MKIRVIIEVSLRYALGLIMLSYGLIKIFNIQFDLPQSAYELQLKELDGVTITWAFLGFSRWFSIALGIFEFIPALLLLFKRTKFIGALLLFPTLLSIFLINNAYGFLPSMRIFTGLLLLTDMVILYAVRTELVKFFRDISQSGSKNILIESIINLTLIGLVAFLIYYFK